MKPVTPLLTVDIIIIREGRIVLIKRKNDPYEGMFALPGGFVDIGETVEQAAIREAKEETGIDINISDLYLIGAYSDPLRDPRGHTVSICFMAYGKGNPSAGSDADGIALFHWYDIPKLAFDHNKILEDANTKYDIGVMTKDIMIVGDVQRDVAKEKIEDLINQSDVQLYPDEMSDMLHIDFELVMDIVQELVKEGRITVTECDGTDI